MLNAIANGIEGILLTEFQEIDTIIRRTGHDPLAPKARGQYEYGQIAEKWPILARRFGSRARHCARLRQRAKESQLLVGTGRRVNEMTDAEFKMTWDLLLTVARTAQFIEIADVQDLLKVVSVSHAMGPMIDPTLYRDHGIDNLQEQQDIAEGFLAFRKAIEKVKARSKVV